MDAFAFVEWPAYLAEIGKFTEIFQLNVPQIAPLQSINNNLGINVFQRMIFMLAMNTSVVVVAIVVYLLVCGYMRLRSLRERQAALSKTRVALYRSTVVLLFIIFPGTCSSITRAITCHTICRSDYTIECNQSHSRKKTVACVSLGYVFLFPALAFVYLFKHHKKRTLNIKKGRQQRQGDFRNTSSNNLEKTNVSAQIPLSDDCKKMVSESKRDSDSIYCEKVFQGEGEERKQNPQDQNDTTVNVPMETFANRGSQAGQHTSSRQYFNNTAQANLVTPTPSEEKRQTVIKLASTRQINQKRFCKEKVQISSEVFKTDPFAEPELLQAVSFLYENFSSNAWYWELIETVRKVLLVSCLGLIGSEGRAYTGLAPIVSGLFAILFAKKQPMNDGFESRLQMLSLTVTFVNLATGVIMKIPSESSYDASGSFLNNIVVDVLLVTTNLSLIVAVTGVL